MVDYKYDLLDEAWDSHWLKSRIHAECDFPWKTFWLTFVNPHVIVEFENELAKEDKTKLDAVMTNVEAGLEPKQAALFEATINPDDITKMIGKKVLYHCIDGHIKIVPLDNLTASDITNLGDNLKNLWQVRK